jgi:MFS family permease
MSGVITQPLWLDEFPQLRMGKSATLLGFVVAFYDIGCLLGAVVIIFFGDKLGRKKSCLLGGCCVLLGVTIQVTVFNLNHSGNSGAMAQFLIGRVITGTGNGINMASMCVSVDYIIILSHIG